MRKHRNSRMYPFALLLIASINLQGVMSSPRWESIRAIDALRLIAAGMLLGICLMVLANRWRTRTEDLD